MKKIINGKKYDTETATAVGSWSNNYSCRDFNHCAETLYRKKTGEYFLYGYGGPMSKYAESCGQNEWSGGERIEPLSYVNARQWAEEHLDVDEYEAEFGEVAEDDTSVALSIRLPADAAEMARKAAAAEEIGLGEYIARIIKNQKQ